MKFLLSVICGAGDVEAVYVPQEAVVDITKAYAELLIKRRAAFQALAAYDNDAWEIYFWSSPCQFVGGRSDAEYRKEAHVAESVLEQLGEDGYDLPGYGWLVIPEGAQIRYGEARTEADQLIVSEMGVCFKAYLKYCNWEIRTSEIPWVEIEKVLNAEEAQKSDDPASRDVDDGYVIGGLVVCSDCVSDAEMKCSPTQLHAGEVFKCARCEQEYMVPKREV